MTNTSKFWVGALIVGAVGIGGVVAYRNRVDLSAPVVSEAVPVETAPPALPMPKPRATEPAPSLVMSTELESLAKPLLTRGTDLNMASEGFKTRESFLAVAYAAKNLEIPFVVLKDRVVAQRMPLAAAIHELKPEADAKAEASRAVAAARSEVMRPIGS